MPEMQLIETGLNYRPLFNQILANPGLWDKHNLRTKAPDSPHREVNDIWLRFRDFSECDPDKPEQMTDKHDSVWYPSMDVLIEARPLIDHICSLVGCAELGGVLITKIPPGCAVYPHSDAGRWHPEYYVSKYLLLLQSSFKQAFCFDNERHEGIAGDLFVFDNRPVHWVVNDSAQNRISLILAMRTHFDNEFFMDGING